LSAQARIALPTGAKRKKPNSAAVITTVAAPAYTLVASMISGPTRKLSNE